MTSFPPASCLAPGECPSRAQLHRAGRRYPLPLAPLCPRYVVLPHPICLERGVSYTIRLELGCATGQQDPTTSVLIDSVRGLGWGCMCQGAQRMWN